MVTSARSTATGEVIGEQIGRPQAKINSYVAPLLYAHEWSKILRMFKDQIHRRFRFFDQESGTMIEREMYVGDRTATVYAYKQDGSGAVEIWKDCSVNFVDMGK